MAFTKKKDDDRKEDFKIKFKRRNITEYEAMRLTRQNINIKNKLLWTLNFRGKNKVGKASSLLDYIPVLEKISTVK